MRNDAPGKKDSAGIFYTLYRKVRFLKHRGTLLHKTPRSIRRKNTLRRRRAWRHAFFHLRPVTYRRFKHSEAFRAIRTEAGPLGYESLSGHKVESPVPVVRRKKNLTLSEKVQRFLRARRYFRTRRKLNTTQLRAIRRNKKRKTWRIFIYLLKRGKLFKVDWVGLRSFFNRNYSFLGKAKYVIILVNSTALFLLSYLFLYLLKLFATAFAAGSYHVHTVLHYWDVDFLIRSGDWTQDMIQVVFGAGPLLALFVFFVTLVIFANTTSENWPARLFLLWVMVHSFVQFFGEVLIGALLSKGFGWVIAYIFYVDTPRMVISLIGLICLVSAGLFSSRYLLYTANIYFNKIDRSSRMPFIMSQIFLPYVFGTVIIIWMKQPRMTQLDLLVSLSMILVLLPATIRARFFGTMYFDEDPKKIRLMWPWLLAAILILPAFRLLFGIGVRF